jgi:hypothetical protein
MTSWRECNTRFEDGQGEREKLHAVLVKFEVCYPTLPQKRAEGWGTHFHRRGNVAKGNRRSFGRRGDLRMTQRIWVGVRLFGVEDDVKEQEAGGGEDDVIAEEHLDP